jgi:hypothetical protein
MSNNIYLAPYSIRVRDVKNDRYVNAGDRNDWGADLLEVFSTYFEMHMPSLPFDPEDKNKKTIRPEFCKKEARTIFGIVKAGEYGLKSELRNVENDQSSYERQTTDAELIPYFFLLNIPNETSQGIAIFQRLGNRGFKDIFDKDFSSHIKGRFSSQYKVEISPLIPRDMVKAYLRNRILKVKLIKHSFPKEVSDVDLSGLPKEEQGEAEFILKAGRNKGFPTSLLDKLRGNIDSFLGGNNTSVGSLLEIQGFQADNVKIEVQVGDKRRTIDFSNIDKLRFTEDVTNRVKIDTNSGSPDFEDLKKIALEFYNDCADALWGRNFL